MTNYLRLRRVSDILMQGEKGPIGVEERAKRNSRGEQAFVGASCDAAPSISSSCEEEDGEMYYAG